MFKKLYFVIGASRQSSMPQKICHSKDSNARVLSLYSKESCQDACNRLMITGCEYKEKQDGHTKIQSKECSFHTAHVEGSSGDWKLTEQRTCWEFRRG